MRPLPPSLVELGLALRAGFQTTRSKRKYAKARREDLAARGLCINGAKHGTADHGRLCKACRETHRRSA